MSQAPDPAAFGTRLAARLADLRQGPYRSRGFVAHGVLPPVLAGARHFVEVNREQLAAIDAESATIGEHSPFDSHPPLPDRIAAVERLGGAERVGESDTRLAIELLRHPEKLVRQLITELVDKPLESVEWDQVAPLFVDR